MLATTEQIKNQLIPRLENKFHTSTSTDSSDSFVTYSALSSALSTVQGGDYDSDIALINSNINSLSAEIAGFSIAYVGTSAPADFNGIFFKIIED